MPKQEKIKSVLFTTGGEFRAGVVHHLNGLGFTAEKHSVDSMKDLTEALAHDPLIWNVLVDFASFGKEATLAQVLADLTQAVAKAPVSVLVFVPHPLLEQSRALQTKHPKLHLTAVPAKRQDLVEGFVKPFMERHGHHTVKKAPPKASAPTANENVVEAIEHVKRTIDQLKQVVARDDALVEFAAIAQRFNGLYGTYLFFGDRDGYHQLGEISEVVDSLGKTYSRAGAPKTLAKPHVELLVRCAKATFALLKDMRDGKPLSESLRDESQKIRAACEAMPELYRSEVLNQDSVDDLLTKYSA